MKRAEVDRIYKLSTKGLDVDISDSLEIAMRMWKNLEKWKIPPKEYASIHIQIMKRIAGQKRRLNAVRVVGLNYELGFK